MTDQELKDLVASLAVEHRKTELMMQEASQEADRRSQEAERRSQEADRRFERLEKKLERMGIQVGGINDNIGYHAEQFFQDVFDEKLEFGGIKYDEMIANLAHKSKKGEVEFDIALINGDCIALIEVKNRIHPDFVIELAEKRVEKFREFFQEFSKYNVYLGIAGFSFSDEVLDRASSYGIGIVRQVGEGVEIEANNLRVY